MAKKVEDKKEEEVDDRPTYFIYDPYNTQLAYRNMMEKRGYKRETKQSEADFVLFTGGPDIHPFLYGETRHEKTIPSLTRDRDDIRILRNCGDSRSQVKIGICRGAQFLNVMVANGSLYQNVDGHDKGYHDASDGGGNLIRVSSTHHQQMIPGPNAKIILKAAETTKWEADSWFWDVNVAKGEKNNWDDPEVIYYPEENMLCFQPHPEFDDPENQACQEFFFLALEEHFLSSKQIEALDKFMAKNKKKVA